MLCPSCQYEILVPFSCKVRGLCPSCQQQRRDLHPLGDCELEADLWAKNGVLLFSIKDGYSGNAARCDDPGCGNMLKITGVIYPVRAGSKWRPQLKARYQTQFAHPESGEDPDGDFHDVVRMDFDQ